MDQRSPDAAGLLERIAATKREEIALLPECAENPDPAQNTHSFPFYENLRRRPGEALRVIAECKKASPSMGLMRREYDPHSIAREYAELGAAAISVLTDHQFFQGKIEDIAEARTCGLPILRKDFILSKRQIYQAALASASAILLIVRMLEQDLYRDLLAYATLLGLDVLSEIHDENELDRVLDTPARIIGINHRNLDTLEMDLSLSVRLAPQIRKKNPDAIIIAESGVENKTGRMQVDESVDAVLVGSAFMKSDDISRVWHELFD